MSLIYHVASIVLASSEFKQSGFTYTLDMSRYIITSHTEPTTLGKAVGQLSPSPFGFWPNYLNRTIPNYLLGEFQNNFDYGPNSRVSYLRTQPLNKMLAFATQLEIEREQMRNR